MGILLTESEAAAAGSGTSMIVMLLVYAVLIGAMWFFFMRPQKKEQKRVAAMLSNLETGDCVLSRLELGKEVRIFLLHLLKKLGLPEHISRVGLLEDLRQTDGGEPVRGVLAVLVRHLGDRDLSRLRPRCLRRPQEPPPREPLIFALVGQTVPPPFSRPRVGT